LFLTDQLLQPSNLAGVQMTPMTATKIATVYSAVRLIADTISTLPLDTFRRIDGRRVPYRPKPAWVDQPDVDRSIARSDFWQSLIFSVLLTGNGYVRIVRTGAQVAGFQILEPTKVEPQLDSRGFIEYVYDHTNLIPASDMVHITDIRKPGALKGFSRVDELKDVLGISRALDEWSARYFSQGTVASGIINVPGDLTQEQADRLKEQFEKNSRGMRNAHRPNILSGGAKYEKLGADATEAQLEQAKRDAVETVARIFKIQPAMLGVTTPGSMSYDSVEQQHIQFVTLTLRPSCSRWRSSSRNCCPVKPSCGSTWTGCSAVTSKAVMRRTAKECRQASCRSTTSGAWKISATWTAATCSACRCPMWISTPRTWSSRTSASPWPCDLLTWDSSLKPRWSPWACQPSHTAACRACSCRTLHNMLKVT
jgi:HK97 family phage portal protein